MAKPAKAKAVEYERGYDPGACTSKTTLLPREIRYVNETSGVQWWWEDVIIEPGHKAERCPWKHLDRNYKDETHGKFCYPDMTAASKKTAECDLSDGHDGPHQSEIAQQYSSTGSDIWLFWVRGEVKSRELREDQKLCKFEADPIGKERAEDDCRHEHDWCDLIGGHGGLHHLYESGSWADGPAA